MKKNLLILSLFTSLVAVAQTGHEINGTIQSGGVTRTYILYVPLKYDTLHATTSVPLIFNFHGLGSTSAQQEMLGDFRKISDSANFIIVHPQGLSGTYTLNQKGFSVFFGLAQSQADVDFTSNLIDTLKAQYNINMNRIYSTGISNGGFMSYEMACQLSGRFAAIATVAGSMVTAQLSVCNAIHPTPLMEIHGLADSTVEYDGTGGLLPASVPYTHIDSLMKHWVKFNHCNPIPTSINGINGDTLPDISTTDGCRAVHYVWSGGTNSSSVELYKIIGGGHQWPGASVSTGLGNQDKDFSASKEIWRFFNQQKSFVGINERILNNTDFSVSPNPTNGML